MTAGRRPRVGITQRLVRLRGDEAADALARAWVPLLALAGLEAVPIPTRWQEPDGAADALRLDGAILSGGGDLAAAPGGQTPDPEREALEGALIRWSERTRSPLLGVCRGLQALAVHHGGSLQRLGGHDQGRHRIDVDPVVPGMVARRETNTSHAYGLGSLGVLRPWARAADGAVEAARHPTLPHWGVMWHPEREAPFHPDDVRLLRHAFGGGAANSL